jgi:hypothetical protein
MFKFPTRRTLVLASVFCLCVALTGITSANHSWGNYHWARTSNPFTLKVGDNVSSAWDAYLDGAVSDWAASSVLNLTKVAGSSNPKNCRPTTGQIEVCNSKYGNNGWLGIAQIWASGSHITQAVTKVNDTYFNTPTYDTPAWRRLVMCQEIGHDFGLDHQDETFDNPNLGTCMDYTNDPDGGAGGASNNDPSNEHPNQHDYDQLVTIYSHTDTSSTVGQTVFGHQNVEGPAPPAMNQMDFEGPGQWGRVVRSSRDGHMQLFELDFGNGHKIFTFVIWADGAERGRGQ